MMTDAPETGLKPKYKRRRYYVHPFQKKYAIIFGGSLFIYSVILFGFTSLAPYFWPMLWLDPDISIDEHASAARQFLIMGETMWLAILGLILSAAFLSIFLTHRIAGPLYRLHQSAKELAEGNLSLRIRFRKKDELHELAEVTNEAIATFENAMIEIRDRAAAERGAVRQLAKLMRAQPTNLQAMTDQLDAALKEGDQIDAVFQRFRFSK